MELREWSLGGILLSPFIIYMAIALGITLCLRVAFQMIGLSRFVWHEALFDFSVFVCVLWTVTTYFGFSG